MKLTILTRQHLLPALLVLLFAQAGFTQDRKLLGRVHDGATQKPLKNVVVVVDESKLVAVTNHLGFFELAVDPALHDSMVVSHIGFKTVKIPIPSEDKFRFALQKVYTLLDSLDLNRFPREFTNVTLPTSHKSPDSYAMFPGGIRNFYTFIGNSLSRQVNSLPANGIAIIFTVDARGRAIDVSSSDSTGTINPLIIQTFEKVPAWIPAKQRHTSVSQYFMLPIHRNAARAPVATSPPDFKDFYAFIRNNMKYPAQARRMGVEGIVYVEFSCDASGVVTGITSQKDIGADCGDEVQRVLAKMPPELGRQLVDNTKNSRFLLPVSFGLGRPFRNTTHLHLPGALSLPEISVTARGVVMESMPISQKTETVIEQSASTQTLGNALEQVGGIMGLQPGTDYTHTNLESAIKNSNFTRRLSLVDRGLTSFPSSILNLKILTFLDLEGNSIDRLPAEIPELSKLKELYLPRNILGVLPSTFGNLTNLRILGLGVNKFQVFPKEITQLTKLEALDMSGNSLSDLPPEIGQLKKLKVLGLRSNSLTTVPSSILELTALDKIDLSGNPIPPDEITALRAKTKVEVIFEEVISVLDRQLEIYGSVLDAETKQPLDHARVLMAGRAGETYSTAPGSFKFVVDSITHLIVGKPGYETRLIKVNTADTTQVWMLRQGQALTEIASTDETFTIVEVSAEFPGGLSAFYTFFARNMRYPPDARRARVQGKVFVEFVVDQDGNLFDVRVVRGVSKSLDDEAVRVIRMSPKWLPGTQWGKPVKQRMVLPVTFKL